jgi:PAS domain S-box-containing protein
MKVEIVNIDEIHNIIIDYANGDFSKRLNVSDRKDNRDSIVAGINMLGEELEQTTISRNYFSNVYNAVSDLLIVTDKKGKVIDVNETTIEKVGLAKDSFIGVDVQSILGTNKSELEEILTNNKEAFSFETSIASLEGKKIPLNCSVSKIIDNNDENQGYLIIAKDISDKKNQEQQLLSTIIATEEKERKRLAYDIHDSLGQELNAIQMYLSSLSHLSSSENQFKKTFEECKVMLDSSINTARNLSFELMPKSLEDGSLCSALEELISRLEGICTFDFDFEFTSVIVNEKQVAIYRVAQEFINNSLKYAMPCRVKMSAKEKGDAIVFIIEDNGSGFEMDKNINGNGIHNIKTRLKAINAEYIYTSCPDKGTRLEFIVNHENN